MKNDLDKFLINDNSIILDVIKSIQITGFRTVVIVENEKKVIGILSEGDILRAFINGMTLHSPIESIINKSFKFLKKRDMNEASKFFKLGLDILPVLSDDFRIIDVVTLTDYLDQKTSE